jgi:hypothetical protein
MIGVMDRPVGLIAGEGQLPVLCAQGIRAAGRQVVCVGLGGQTDAPLPPLCDRYAAAGVIRLGQWIRLLRKWGAQEAIMVGRVRKARMYEPFRLLRQIPDWRAARLWFRVLRHDRRNEALLCAVANELAAGGIRLIDSTQYIQEHLASEGVLTRTQPNAKQRADIDFALPIVAQLNELDVGQAVAVVEREILAVEAIEGTDRMIERAGELCRVGGWTLVKTSKANQDMRFDVPTLGVQTIENLKRHRGACIAVEAGRVILLDKPNFLAAADKAGIPVVGIRLR